MKTIRILLALATFLVVTEWSRPAHADVSIQGTVGEVGVLANWSPLGQGGWVRFKLTDLNQTATCNYNNGNGPDKGYAYFSVPTTLEPNSKEWLSMLLYSKKGAPVVITLTNNTANCRVTSITLS